MVDRCRRDGSPVSVLMFDLDRFKEINDTFGHAVGDAVLKFCEVASGALRPNDVFGRIGGEEFAVVLPGSGIQAAWVRAERIRTSFMETCRKLGDFAVDATVSGGVATSAAPDRSLDMLLASADVALYNAKIEGRNRIKRSNDPSPDGGEPGVIGSQEAATAARPLRASPRRGLITMAPRPSPTPDRLTPGRS